MFWTWRKARILVLVVFQSEKRNITTKQKTMHFSLSYTSLKCLTEYSDTIIILYKCLLSYRNISKGYHWPCKLDLISLNTIRLFDCLVSVYPLTPHFNIVWKEIFIQKIKNGVFLFRHGAAETFDIVVCVLSNKYGEHWNQNPSRAPCYLGSPSPNWTHTVTDWCELRSEVLQVVWADSSVGRSVHHFCSAWNIWSNTGRIKRT